MRLGISGIQVQRLKLGISIILKQGYKLGIQPSIEIRDFCNCTSKSYIMDQSTGYTLRQLLHAIKDICTTMSSTKDANLA